MNIFKAIILGIIQGLTEFLPVSSTAHLLIMEKILALPSDSATFSFTVIIQIGTIVSLIIVFWRDLITIIKAFFQKPFSSPENKLAWFILIATLPALIVGFLLKDVVESLFSNPLLEAGIRLLISATLLALAEGLGRKERSLSTMTWFDALFVGLFQAIAVFPGASRSGTTISAGIFRGFDRSSAARFAFLMSIPVMIAAGGYQMIDVLQMPSLSSYWIFLLVGFIVAAGIGWLAIRWLLKYISSHSLIPFSIYTGVVGLITLAVHWFFQ